MPYEAQLAETVNIRGRDNDLMDTYLARPIGSGPYPGVVVIHHMPGWDEATKEIARKFAHHGYIAISPNLHYREGKATAEENSASVRAAGGMPDDRTMGDVQGAISHLRTLPYLNGKVGIIGYCSGGRQAYLAACRLSGIDAAIDCYGGGVVAPPAELSPRQPVAPIEYSKACGVHCSGFSGGRTGVRRQRMWQESRRNSPDGERPMSSTCMRTPGTASSRWIDRATVKRQPWRDGSRFFVGMKSISVDLLGGTF